MVAGTVTSRRAYRCAICGVELRDRRWIYSSHTGDRYCPVEDFQACETRSLTKRLAK